MTVEKNEPLAKEWPYDCVELPIVIEGWRCQHAPCAECDFKNGENHSLEECGLFP